MLFGATSYGGGQWFLWALLEAYILFFVMCKLKMKWLLYDRAVEISILLFSVHIFVRFILVGLGVTSIGPISLNDTYVVRNVYFDAIPFMLLGFKMHDGLRLKTDKELLWMVLFGALSILESLLAMSLFPNTNCVLYVGTILAEFFAFKYCIKSHSTSENLFWNAVVYFGTNCSMIAYFIHPMVGTLIKEFNLSNSIFPFAVIFVTVCVSIILYKFVYFVRTSYGGRIQQ